VALELIQEMLRGEPGLARPSIVRSARLCNICRAFGECGARVRGAGRREVCTPTIKMGGEKRADGRRR